MKKGIGLLTLISAHPPPPNLPGYAAALSSLSSVNKPPGYGVGMNQLAASDLNVFLPQMSDDADGFLLNRREKPFMHLPRETHPAISLLQEKACLDNSFSRDGKKKFMSLYGVEERVMNGVGQVKVHIPKEPQDDSPSSPIYENPSHGLGFIIDSVFRTILHKKASSTTFTSWVACPALGSQREAICFTSGHCFEDQFGISYRSGDIDCGWRAGSGCFGSIVDIKRLSSGFEVETKPLAISYNEQEDIVCFKTSDPHSQFLLPCSPDEVLCTREPPFLASYGYPCIDHFLYQAYEELVLKSSNHGIANLYKNVVSDTDLLYKLLVETFGGFPEGRMTCSPGILIGVEDCVLKIKSSTLQGSSGSPVIPIGLSGYAIGTHEGGSTSDSNIATSTHSTAFVDSYSRFVLPNLPNPSDNVWNGRDLAPFRRWLHKHGLKWYDQEIVQEEVRTPPAKPMRYPWAINA